MLRGRSFAAGALFAFVAFGCAQERPAINRVQADALAKSFFVGQDLRNAVDDPEFYKRSTIVDLPYGAGYEDLLVPQADPISRIRWEITETSLNARLAYERIAGTDGKGLAVDGSKRVTNDGQIVASYKIESHFDIKREYNPQTGEELNIVSENTSDRPWYAREYMRVDWSKNLVSAYDFDTLSDIGIEGAVTYESFAYSVLNPSDPDAPHFDAAEGYFDVTNKAYATPQIVDLSPYGFHERIPACYLINIFGESTYPWGDCNSIEITVRDSYRRVVDTDYEPADIDPNRFSVAQPLSWPYRRGYDRGYGMTDQQWNRFVSRYNLWEKSHYYADPVAMDGAIPCATKATTEDPTGDPNADPNRDVSPRDGTADECQGAGSGSRCDIFKNKCTLPYRERKARVIPWYIAGDTTLFEPTNFAALEWDLALKTAVETGRLAECRRTGGEACDTQYPMWTGQQDDNEEASRIARDVDACRRQKGWSSRECDELGRSEARDLAAERGHPNDAGTLAIGEVAVMPPIFVLCHNPVVAEDHPACGKEGLVVRLGDIRYHIVNNIQAPQRPAYWGVEIDGADPLTGEKVAGSMNIWTAETDRIAQSAADILRYINGELTAEEITNGDYVRDWVGAAKAASGGASPTLSKWDIARRLANPSRVDASRLVDATGNAHAGTPAAAAAVAKAAGAMTSLAFSADATSQTQAKVRATLERARGTPVETALVNPAMAELAGIDGSSPVAGDLVNVASPLMLNNPLAWQRLRDARARALADRGACVYDAAPDSSSFTGLADIMSKKFPRAPGESSADRAERYRKIVDYLRRKFQYTVMAHEMGHSIGMRHDFVASGAPMSYPPQYWQLRTKNGKVGLPCADAVDDGSTCVGPRYWDPVTDEERSQLQPMWMRSSVMDYFGDLSQDLLGLGPIDYAAARLFYTDVVSVFTNPDYQAGTDIGTGILWNEDNWGGSRGITYGLRGDPGLGVDLFHYSQLQRNFKLIQDCYATRQGAPPGWNEGADGKWDVLLDGHVVTIDGQPTKCRQQQVDYVLYSDLRMPTEDEMNGPLDNWYFLGTASVDAKNRLRVPTPYASENRADIGNTSVYRHDNGADPYEVAQYLITSKETRHIFDNYRRGRSTFTVKGAADYAFNRYNLKLQSIAASMASQLSWFHQKNENAGEAFDTVWPDIVRFYWHDSMLASTLVFDHFVRELTRPEAGGHYAMRPLFEDPVLHSDSDPDDWGPDQRFGSALLVPNGASGYFRDIGFGGRPLENALLDGKREFSVWYVANAGSYYDKIHSAILLSLSEDRYIAETRQAFFDARSRAIGLADLFPDGFRRVIANALTGDRSILASRVEATPGGAPILDTEADTSIDPQARMYPKHPLGWSSFWPKEGPEVCFATQGRNVCSDFAGVGAGYDPLVAANTVYVDPQIGWEVQKFLVAWTMAFVTANQRSEWIDMMSIYRLGRNTNPLFEPRIEWQDPTSGETYYARSYGKECLFGDAPNGCAGGKLVEKGIAARVLEYANFLTSRGYKLDEANYPTGFNTFGRAMVLHHPDGHPIVKVDPAVGVATPNWGIKPAEDCDQNITPTCTQLTTDQNHWAYQLLAYKSVPDFLGQVALAYGLSDGSGSPR